MQALLLAAAVALCLSSAAQAKTTFIVDPSATTTTITVDEHSAAACDAPATVADPPIFTHGKTGYIMTVELKDESWKTHYDKLAALNKMDGSFHMQLDAGKNKVVGFGIMTPESWMAWNTVFASLPSEMAALGSIAAVHGVFFGTSTPEILASLEAWNTTPGFSISFSDMEVGSLGDLTNKPKAVGFVLDTEFPSPEAMQDCVDHFLKGKATGLMMGYGVAHAAVVAGPTRLFSVWAFENEAQWFAYDAAQKAAAGDIIMKYFVEGSSSTFAAGFGPVSAAYEESVAAWNAIPHFDCAIRKVVQGSYVDGPTGFYNVATFKTSKLAKKWAPHIDKWKPHGEAAKAVTMSSVLLSPTTLSFWVLFQDNDAQTAFDALISTDEELPQMFDDMVFMKCQLLGSSTFETEKTLDKWFAHPKLMRSTDAPIVAIVDPTDAPSASKMQYSVDIMFAEPAQAKAMAMTMYKPTVFEAYAEARATVFGFMTGPTALKFLASFTSCEKWVDVNNKTASDLQSGMVGMVRMDSYVWGAVSEACQAAIEPWKAIPGVTVTDGITTSGGFL